MPWCFLLCSSRVVLNTCGPSLTWMCACVCVRKVLGRALFGTCSCRRSVNVGPAYTQLVVDSRRVASFRPFVLTNECRSNAALPCASAETVRPSTGSLNFVHSTCAFDMIRRVSVLSGVFLRLGFYNHWGCVPH